MILLIAKKGHNRHFSQIFLESPSTRLIPDVSEWDVERKGEWLFKESLAFLQQIFLPTNTPDGVIMLDEAHKQGFTCRHINCEMHFPLHSSRVR